MALIRTAGIDLGFRLDGYERDASRGRRPQGASVTVSDRRCAIMGRIACQMLCLSSGVAVASVPFKAKSLGE